MAAKARKAASPEDVEDAEILAAAAAVLRARRPADRQISGWIAARQIASTLDRIAAAVTAGDYPELPRKGTR